MLIDLSHRIVGGMTVFPGDPEVSIADAATLKDDGFRVSALHLGSHTGTHLDAPSHSIADGASLEAVALEQLIAPLVVLDARDRSARGAARCGRRPGCARPRPSRGGPGRPRAPREYVPREPGAVDRAQLALCPAPARFTFCKKTSRFAWELSIIVAGKTGCAPGGERIRASEAR